jgi:hypothetical protein
MEQESAKRKPDQQLLTRLIADDDKIKLKALGELRSSGRPEYIPVLLDIMNNTNNKSILQEIQVLLADIKDKGIMTHFIEALRDPKFKKLHAGIASACWQSGLDYSSHLDLFIKLFLESDYITALEAFSVIEESLENMTEDDIGNKRSLLLKGFEQISEEKKPLAKELLYLMDF